MEFSCSVTIEDLVAFNLHVAARLRPPGLNWNRISVALGPAVVLGMFLWRTSGPASLAFAAVIAAVVYLEWPVVQRSMLEKFVRRIHAGDIDPSVLGAQEYRFSDVGIESRFATGHGLYRWPNVIDVAETEGHVFIHLSPVKAIIIPNNGTLRGATASAIAAAVRERIAANA